MNNPNRPKIIEAYQVPGGNVSPDIFKLPCIYGAEKLRSGNVEYWCKNGYYADDEYAHVTDYICKSDDGKWFVLSADEYHEYNLNL